MKLIRLLLLSCIVLSAAACSQKKDASCDTGTAPTPICAPLNYSSLDSAAVSFKTDVYPRLRAGCSAPFCHGQKPLDPPVAQPSAGLYLGIVPENDPTKQPTPDQITADIAFVLTQLMASANTIMSMKRVVPSDPANSFALLKLTGCQGSVSGCKVQPAENIVTYTQGCGDVMPPGCDHADWTAADVVLFARWVQQGAANN